MCVCVFVSRVEGLIHPEDLQLELLAGVTAEYPAVRVKWKLLTAKGVKKQASMPAIRIYRRGNGLLAVESRPPAVSQPQRVHHKSHKLFFSPQTQNKYKPDGFGLIGQHC